MTSFGLGKEAVLLVVEHEKLGIYEDQLVHLISYYLQIFLSS